jgi:GTP pyrophosphokinase
MFTPIVARIKDFIATPEFNMYQSLHTTVIGPGGRIVEVQIRTHEMHQTAETGIAAHWRYKEGKVHEDEIDKYMGWLWKIVDWQSGTPEPAEFLHEFKMDLFQEEIFVFTPKGDLIQLPVDATALDFAFALHSEIGLHCIGAKVNGRMIPIDTKLKSGECVEILTNSSKHPVPGWLNIVKTAKARSLVRRWIKRQHFVESRNLGIDMIVKLEKQLGQKIAEKEQLELIRKYHQRDWDHFLGALGSGTISFHTIQHNYGLTPEKAKTKLQNGYSKDTAGMTIKGMENLLINFAQCCKPLPGDDIVGFVSRGRGLIIHRADCSNITREIGDQERSIDVDWKTAENMLFVASIRVEAANRKSLLSDITSVIAKSNCNIRNAKIETVDEIAVDDFDIDVKNLSDLQKLMAEVRKVKGVSRVTRLDMRSPKASA